MSHVKTRRKPREELAPIVVSYLGGGGAGVPRRVYAVLVFGALSRARLGGVLQKCLVFGGNRLSVPPFLRANTGTQPFATVSHDTNRGHGGAGTLPQHIYICWVLSVLSRWASVWLTFFSFFQV